MKGKFSIGTGIPSILMIFVVLCLTTFAVLSYSSARADKRLTEKNSDYIMKYYEADAKAQEMLARLDAVLYTAKEKASDNFSYQNEVASAVANLDEEISIEMDTESGIVLKYSAEINASQQLEVRLRTAAYEEDKRYVVESYRVTAPEQGTEADFNDESIGWWQGN